MNLRSSRVAVATASLVFIGLAVPGPATSAVAYDTEDFLDAVTVEGIRAHQAALQDAADANGGVRASGTPGYEASGDYVTSELEAAGYSVTRQDFEYEFYQENSPAELQQVSPAAVDYETQSMEYSGAGDVMGPLVGTNDLVVPFAETPNTSTSGCELADFPAAPAANSIALIQRGSCSFRDKADNAAAAGYAAAIIFNEGQPGRDDIINGTLDAPQAAIPVVDAAYATGADLYDALQAGTVTARVFVDAEVVVQETFNLIAETAGGRADRVVMAGAHLDSVAEGPGIQDNGSGSAAILEIALQLAASDIEPVNKVRFGWWGAEESGLIGSQYYVDQLGKKDISAIAAYLNFDMIGSPNFVRYIYDGDGDAFGIKGPNGSARIEAIFEDYFDSRDLANEPTEFDGRSDYDAFISVGIPAGGLFTGAEGIKSEEEAAIYGGTAGQAYDPCYHQACDTFDNISLEVLDEMGDAAAHATLLLAMTSSAVNGTGKASGQATESSSVFKGSHAVR